MFGSLRIVRAVQMCFPLTQEKICSLCLLLKWSAQIITELSSITWGKLSGKMWRIESHCYSCIMGLLDLIGSILRARACTHHMYTLVKCCASENGFFATGCSPKWDVPQINRTWGMQASAAIPASFPCFDFFPPSFSPFYPSWIWGGNWNMRFPVKMLLHCILCWRAHHCLWS